ncbi:transcription factor TFIIH complex subunit Tfb5-domain-containing protein [Filobasidium floriforme]|uniref:transcription factor TFIIH complex subunit Tfb5-domain-containing protein n=1 Tax=Filobasidium floriforme TaxID=5210 RepID=UPI001E8DFDBF|nr:transcription factor TFIIH complex subunit Tfb5-domain-containing protein [Filobasidium floriforme]KAH8087005.1 transcription factor TFIIH complex subunit Tfb5-domain-containing protein [Filobasidium floriforme]
MDLAYLAQQGSGQQGYTTRQGTGFARDKVEITRGMLVKTDPAAKQLLIHLNKKRAEAGHEQFIVADLDAEHLMVKANVMEEVEKEFQAQLEEFTFRHTDEEEVKKGKTAA